MSSVPHELASLRARVDDAIADLADIRHHDPAATEAIDTARLTARTLQAFWVPALDEALGSTDIT
jgi:hypothetical protein